MELTIAQLTELSRLLAATAPQEMDCAAFLDHVAEFLDHPHDSTELPQHLKQIRQHLEVCQECREEFELLVRATRDAK